MINLGVDIRERAAKMELNKKKLRLTKNNVEGKKHEEREYSKRIHLSTPKKRMYEKSRRQPTEKTTNQTNEYS